MPSRVQPVITQCTTWSQRSTLHEPKRKPDGRFQFLPPLCMLLLAWESMRQIWCQNCIQHFNIPVISLAVDKWLSKGDIQLQPGSESGKLGSNDLISSWKVQIIDLGLCQSAESTCKAAEGVPCVPAEGRTGGKKAIFGWPEVKEKGFDCDSVTRTPGERKEPLPPPLVLLLWVALMYCWQYNICKTDLLLWVWHNANTAREISGLVWFPMLDFPVPPS